jgi:hypothetical protein
MPKLRWFVACENVVIDQETDRVTTVGILDRITPVEFPALLVKVGMAGCWDCTGADPEQDYQVAISISPPGNKEAKIIRTNLKETKERTQQIMVLGIGFVPVETSGEILIEVRLNDESIQVYKIDVLAADPNDGDRSLFYPESTRETDNTSKEKPVS